MDWNMLRGRIEAIILELYFMEEKMSKTRELTSEKTVYLCFNCEKSKVRKKEKKKIGWYKKTTRNCFFNGHFNIENDSGTLQNSATNN